MGLLSEVSFSEVKEKLKAYGDVSAPNKWRKGTSDHCGAVSYLKKIHTNPEDLLDKILVRSIGRVPISEEEILCQ